MAEAKLDLAGCGSMVVDLFYRTPKFVRAELYLYHFTDSHADGAWWKREHVAHYLPPLSLDSESFREVLKEQGWME